MIFPLIIKFHRSHFGSSNSHLLGSFSSSELLLLRSSHAKARQEGLCRTSEDGEQAVGRATQKGFGCGSETFGCGSETFGCKKKTSCNLCRIAPNATNCYEGPSKPIQKRCSVCEVEDNHWGEQKMGTCAV